MVIKTITRLTFKQWIIPHRLGVLLALNLFGPRVCHRSANIIRMRVHIDIHCVNYRRPAILRHYGVYFQNGAEIYLTWIFHFICLGALMFIRILLGHTPFCIFIFDIIVNIFVYIIDALASLTIQNSKVLTEVIGTWKFACIRGNLNIWLSEKTKKNWISGIFSLKGQLPFELLKGKGFSLNEITQRSDTSHRFQVIWL